VHFVNSAFKYMPCHVGKNTLLTDCFFGDFANWGCVLFYDPLVYPGDEFHIFSGSPIPTPSTECQDFEEWCPRMAKYGECESQEQLTKMFCRKSCKFCLEGIYIT